MNVLKYLIERVSELEVLRDDDTTILGKKVRSGTKVYMTMVTTILDKAEPKAVTIGTGKTKVRARTDVHPVLPEELDIVNAYYYVSDISTGVIYLVHK